MPALKQSVARILQGLAASAFLAPVVCAAAQFKVNNEAPLDMQSPPGFTYVAQGLTGTLSVATTGFALCTNIGGNPATNVTLVPQHGEWRFPNAIDLATVVYGGSTLSVNSSRTTSNPTTLVCHTAGSQGELNSGLTEGILHSGFDSKAVEQFTNLINWIPPSQGFDWNHPNWAQVPTDPCSPSTDFPARIDEDVACGAVVGTRQGVGGAVRSPTLWTGTDGVNYFYVVRIDARYGPQNEIDGTGPALPTPGVMRDSESATNVELKVVEGYDRGVLGVGGGYLGDTGQWCYMTDLPDTLGGNMCQGAVNGGTLNGPFVSGQDSNFDITVGLPPANPRVSFYMGFIRPIVGSPPLINEPAVAISILLDPSVGAEGGDRFKGDDIVFGFLPTSPGFPWMPQQ
jgi:hypothetical protein